MSSRPSWVFIDAVVLPLVYVYLFFIAWLARNPHYLPATWVETAVLGTALLRLGIVLAVPRLRRARLLGVLDIFTIEILLVPILAVASIVFSSAYYVTLVGEIVWAWPPAFLLTFLPFAIYRVVSKMREAPPVSTLVPGVIGLLVTLILLATATTSSTSSSGLMGLSRLLLSAVIGSVSSPSIPISVSYAVTWTFVVLSVYAITSGRDAPASKSTALLFPVLGTLAAVVIAFASSNLTGSVFLVFGLPAFVLIGLVWRMTRER